MDAPTGFLRRLVRRRRLLLAIALAVLLLDASWRVTTASRDLLAAYRDLSAAAATLHVAEGSLVDALPDAGQYAEARARVSAASDRIVRAHARLAYLRPALRAAGVLPWVGPSARDASRLLDGGADVAPSIDRLLAATAPIFEDPEAPLLPTTRRVMVDDRAAIAAGLEAIDGARATFLALEPDRWVWPMSTVSGDVDRFAGAVEDLGELGATFDAASAAFDALFGYGEPVQWLLLGQNDQEIRPTGGFIGSMGLVTIDSGEVTEQDYRASLDFDPPDVPAHRRVPDPLTTYLGLGYWYVRDTNWWPDFPTSAREALALLEEDQGLTPDGVIALDSHAVGQLLDVFGPLAVSGYNEPLTSENWFRLAEESVTGVRGNPNAADGTTAGWSTVEPNQLEAIRLDEEGIPAGGLPEGVRTGVLATVQGAQRVFAYPVELEPGVQYAGSVFVRVPSDWDGGQLLLDLSEFEGMEGGSAVPVDLSVRDAWQQVVVRGTPGADTFGNLRLYTDLPPSSARSIIVTNAVVSAGDGGLTAATSQQGKQDYLQPVLEALLRQAEAASAARLPALAAALQAATEGRHLQAYHRDPGVQEALLRLGIAGSFAVTTMDGAVEELIAVVDANVTYSKIQPAITRDITVLLRADGGRDVVVRWHNGVDQMALDQAARLGTSGTVYRRATGEYLRSPGVFGTYTRVFAPAGSAMEFLDGFDSPPGLSYEGDFVAFGGYVEVVPGATRQAVFSYFPAAAGDRVRFWKQGGTVGDTLRVIRNVEGMQDVLYEGPFTRDVVLDVAP